MSHSEKVYFGRFILGLSQRGDRFNHRLIVLFPISKKNIQLIQKENAKIRSFLRIPLTNQNPIKQECYLRPKPPEQRIDRESASVMCTFTSSHLIYIWPETASIALTDIFLLLQFDPLGLIKPAKSCKHRRELGDARLSRAARKKTNNTRVESFRMKHNHGEVGSTAPRHK